ncbi:MAG: condensation domain-containing protein, partial [Gammaproteobacteria bacterium]
MNGRREETVDGWTSAAVEFDPFAEAITASAPATPHQREIWAAAQLGGEADIAYNQAFCVHLTGKLDRDALAGALRELVARHQALRLCFASDGESLCLRADADVDVPVESLAASGRTLADIEQHEVSTPFDLVHGPLIRFRIAVLGPTEHAVLVTAHHVICDGWSIGVLIDEMARLYAESNPPGPAPGFLAYAEQWAADEVAGTFAAQESWWLENLADAPAQLDLPLDHPRPPMRRFCADCETLDLPDATVATVRTLAAETGCTPFTVISAAFTAWLHRLTDSGRVVIGVPAAGQPAAGLPGLVGHCVSLLPVYSHLDPGTAVSDYLANFREWWLDANDHRDISLGRIVERLGIRRNPGSIPLVQVVLNMDREMPAPSFGEGLAARVRMLPKRCENFEWFVNAQQTGEGIRFECTYNTALFSAESMRERLDSLATFIRAFCSDSGQAVESLALFGDADGRRLAEWGTGPAIPLENTSLDRLIVAQCADTPRAVAVSQGEQTLRYAE